MSDYVRRKDVIDGTRECFITPWVRELFITMVKDLPTADVRENVHGEWIPKERTTECSVDIDIVCSKCGYVGIEGYAHGYELDELPVQEMKDYIKKLDMNYCPCCRCSMDKGDI